MPDKSKENLQKRIRELEPKTTYLEEEIEFLRKILQADLEAQKNSYHFITRISPKGARKLKQKEIKKIHCKANYHYRLESKRAFKKFY